MKFAGLKKVGTLIAAGVVAVMALPAPKAQAQDVCLGSLMLFGGNYCPRGYANADGTLMPIAQYSALFSILGTMYGGDGRTTFGLPDLRGRAAAHVGIGPGITPTPNQGAQLGTTSFNITTSNMPSHTHQPMAMRAPGATNNPSGEYLGSGSFYTSDTSAGTAPMAPGMIGNTGGNVAIQKQSPIQVLRYCVATQGIYCSRS